MTSLPLLGIVYSLLHCTTRTSVSSKAVIRWGMGNRCKWPILLKNTPPWFDAEAIIRQAVVIEDSCR
jgi:hypothetical protein